MTDPGATRIVADRRPAATAALRAACAAALFCAAALSTGSAAGEDPPREIAVVARRFAFDPPRIEVALGERVRLLVVAADGVHGLEIKKFKVNREIPKGTTPMAIEFTASAVGEYPILCSEYCGAGHTRMKGELVVSTRDVPAK